MEVPPITGGSGKSTNRNDARPQSPPRGRQSKSWEDKNAIEYDVSTQLLSKVPRDNIKETTHTMVKIPRRGFSPGDRVTISIPVGTDEDSTDLELCLANVRMRSLPRDVFWQRMRGHVQTIYVRGVRAGSVSPSPSSRASSVAIERT